MRAFADDPSLSMLEFSITPTHDPDLAARLQRAIDDKTKPRGALGRLETTALCMGLIQRRLDPRQEHPQALVFAADHGATRRPGISAFPREVTWQMVENFLAGGAAINVFCRQHGIPLAVVDAGVDHVFAPRPGLIDAKLAFGSNDYLQAPALGRKLAVRSLATGAELVRRLPPETDCLLLGEMGIGNTASATLLTHCFTGAPLEAITGRGTGLDDEGLATKRRLLETALVRGGVPANPIDVLAEYGGLEIGQIAGAMLAAAERRLVILVDGFIVTAALLVAHALEPAVLDYCLFSHRSQEPGHRLQLERLGAEALLELDLRLGEGTGAALAYPLIVSAAAFLREMASFSAAGVASGS